MKKKYGSVIPDSDGSGEDDHNINGHRISHHDLSEIIRMRAEELLRLIMMELPRNEHDKLIPCGLVLTGGSSNLPGLAELGRDITHVPVRIGVPLNLYGVSDVLMDPAYATSVGLLLWKSKAEGTQGWETKSGLRRLMNKLFRLFR
jgi:cell division protein FtsA